MAWCLHGDTASPSRSSYVNGAATVTPNETNRQITLVELSIAQPCQTAVVVYWTSAPYILSTRLYLPFSQMGLPMEKVHKIGRRILPHCPKGIETNASTLLATVAIARPVITIIELAPFASRPIVSHWRQQFNGHHRVTSPSATRARHKLVHSAQVDRRTKVIPITVLVPVVRSFM